jgi:hypothetical protein
MNRIKSLTPVIFFLILFSIIINILLEVYIVPRLLNPLQKDALLTISLLIFIPMILSILAVFNNYYYLLYCASFIAILLGLYLMGGNGFIQIFGLLQLIYPITAVFITIERKKKKNELP